MPPRSRRIFEHEAIGLGHGAVDIGPAVGQNTAHSHAAPCDAPLDEAAKRGYERLLRE